MPAPYQPSDWLDALGVAIKEARQERDLSQEELGHKLRKPWRKSAHRNYIGETERGQRNPSVKFIVEVVNELDGDVVGLFQRAQQLLETANTDAAQGGPLHYR